MTLRLIFVLAVATALTLSAAHATERAWTIMTFNIRMNTPLDGANAWPHRKELAASVFKKNDVDVAGLQEVLPGQLEDLASELPEYAWVGVGREDGKTQGEHTPVFYRKDRFDLLRKGSFWLSQTPGKPGSMGWDAACTRVATWVVLREKATGRAVFFLNTHLDHRGVVARKKSAALLDDKIASLAKGLPVILTADFNSHADDSALQTLTSSKQVPLRVAPFATPDTASFNGFGKAESKGQPIDYILASPKIGEGRAKILRVKRGQLFVSDHWPVIAQLAVPAQR